MGCGSSTSLRADPLRHVLLGDVDAPEDHTATYLASVVVRFKRGENPFVTEDEVTLSLASWHWHLLALCPDLNTWTEAEIGVALRMIADFPMAFDLEGFAVDAFGQAFTISLPGSLGATPTKLLSRLLRENAVLMLRSGTREFTGNAKEWRDALLKIDERVGRWTPSQLAIALEELAGGNGDHDSGLATVTWLGEDRFSLHLSGGSTSYGGGDRTPEVLAQFLSKLAVGNGVFCYTDELTDSAGGFARHFTLGTPHLEVWGDTQMQEALTAIAENPSQYDTGTARVTRFGKDAFTVTLDSPAD